MREYYQEAKTPEDAYKLVKTYETVFQPTGFVLDDPQSMIRLGECYLEVELFNEALALSKNALLKRKKRERFDSMC